MNLKRISLNLLTIRVKKNRNSKDNTKPRRNFQFRRSIKKERQYLLLCGAIITRLASFLGSWLIHLGDVEKLYLTWADAGLPTTVQLITTFSHLTCQLTFLWTFLFDASFCSTVQVRCCVFLFECFWLVVNTRFVLFTC